MQLDVLFLTLTFIIIIIVILIADNLSTAASVLTIITSFFVIYTLSHKTASKYIAGRDESDKPDAGAVPDIPSTTQDTILDLPSDATQNTNLYGAEYEKYHAYVNSYDLCSTKPQSRETPADIAIDTRVALNAQRRARDKRTIEGAVVKDANFYKYHFADELEREENKPWWGAREW